MYLKVCASSLEVRHVQRCRTDCCNKIKVPKTLYAHQSLAISMYPGTTEHQLCTTLGHHQYCHRSLKQQLESWLLLQQSSCCAQTIDQSKFKYLTSSNVCHCLQSDHRVTCWNGLKVLRKKCAWNFCYSKSSWGHSSKQYLFRLRQRLALNQRTDLSGMLFVFLGARCNIREQIELKRQPGISSKTLS